MFNMYVAEVTAINGPSMYPFFNPHYNESLRKDWVLVKKHYLMGHLKRGMIVIFWYTLPLPLSLAFVKPRFSLAVELTSACAAHT